MSKRDIDSLLNRGKHYVCQYITSGCYEPNTEKSLDVTSLVEKHLQSHDHRRVHHVIDYLFDYRNNITPEELVEWLKYIIGGRRLPNTFSKEVKAFDTSSKCGLVWTTNFVAYRCRTCAISLCMSLCTDCFLNGNHEGHDFNMFRSQAGGACDCGDPFVMKEGGFCHHHKPKGQDSLTKTLPPNSLLCIANEIVPRLLQYLVLYLRENNFANNKKANALLSDVLIYLNDLGTLMQSIICQALTDPVLYRNSLNSINKEGDLDYQHRIRNLTESYRKAVQEIQLSNIFNNVDTSLISECELVKDIESFKAELVHRTFLDEIIFWTILNEFPSNLITFLLKMLPDEEYKRQFADSFVKHYFRISMLILHPTERFLRNGDRDIFYNKLANAVVHVSVQLFSNENLALLLCDNLKLLYIIIISLKYAIEGNRKNYWGILVPNLLLNPHERKLELKSPNKSTTTTEQQPQQQQQMTSSDGDTETSEDECSTLPHVVSCDHSILRLHRFWPIVSDLNNLFTHERIARSFLEDSRLIDLWLEFIMSFQAMNMNKKLSEADDDNSNYKAAYLSELEICASQMWTLISHLKSESSRQLTINFVGQALKWLQTWMKPLKLEEKQLNEIDMERCSFHLPLHRYYSVFMHHAATVQKVPLDELLPKDSYELKCLIVHPLQTLIVYHHIMAGLWMTNGLQIKTQAINYMQPHFCNSTIDADIFLIQQVATRILPDEFIDMFSSSYGLKQYMYIYPIASTPMETDKLVTYLENAFTFLATLVSQHINLGLNATEVTRKEMVALLSISEKTHSQIHDTLPYKNGFLMNNSFIEILNDIADYKSPEVEASGSLVQGYFSPKSQVWEHEFDPLFILYRNAYRRDFQTSLQRFATYARQSGKYTSSSLPWPPFRVPSHVNSSFIDPRCILNSKTLHSFYFSILMKALNESSMVTQHLLSIVVYLMELSLIEASKKEDGFEMPSSDFKSVDSILESEFHNWFPSSDIVDNFMVNIKKIQTCELKFENESFKTKFLTNLFNSLMHDDYNIFRDFDEYAGMESPTIIVENEDDEGENGGEVHDLSFNLSDYFNEDSGQPIEDNCNYLESVDDDNDDDDDEEEEEESYNVNSDRMTVDSSQMSTDDTTTTVASSSSSNSSRPTTQASTPSQGSKSSRSKLSFAKTKPLRFEYEMDESILTLMLKLFSKLNGKRDSFKTDQASLSAFDFSSRIGDGPYFIGCLLKRFILICAKRIEVQKQSESIDLSDNVEPSSDLCMKKAVAIVNEARKKIWPNLLLTAAEQEVLPSTSQELQPQSTSSSSSSNSGDDNHKSDAMDVDMEELERLEKKRRALELKQQIMNKFRNMQNAFIQNNQDADEDAQNINVHEKADSSSDNENESSDTFMESQPKYEPKSYQCVICGVSGFSTLERSFVQVVLLQSSSILGNAQAHSLSEELTEGEATTTILADQQQQHQPSTSSPRLGTQFDNIPISDEEYTAFTERKTFANYFEQRVDTSSVAFALDSWLSSFNIGWCGGVHAQSCGHFMHMDCYQSYMASVHQNRETNDLIEYSCPLCRKVANSVLPIIPNFANLYALVKSRNHKDPHGVAVEILDLLSNGDRSRLANTTEDESKFLKVLAMAIEDVMRATEPQYRNIRVEPSPQSLFLFLSSISRTNLEYTILLWRENLLRSNHQTSCFVHLFQALSLNAKLVLPMHYTRLWSQITGIDSDDDSGSNLMPYEKHVPLLLKDVSAILLQFLYALPFNIDKAYFISITQALLNLNFIQALVLITYQMSPEQRLDFKAKGSSVAEATATTTNNDIPAKFETIFDYIAFIMNNFDLNVNSLTIMNFFTIENHHNLTEDAILSLIAKICLPFLRVASILFHLLYLEPTLPEYRSIANCSSSLEEFSALSSFLHLNPTRPQLTSEDLSSRNTHFFGPFINWFANNPSTLISIWYREFDKFVQANTMAARNLIKESFIIAHRPRLLQLPTIYEQLFMFYHKRTCVSCNTVPKDASICLICGRLVCIREACCRSGNCMEGVTHSKKCGAGTAIYLAINSSSIIVIRGKKACIWGSVYLDEFGEEDRDLKRGKPLFLCKERYRILEQQWLTHSFSHINKKWVYHKEAL